MLNVWQEQTPLGEHSMGGGSPIANGTETVQERVDRQAATVGSWFCGLADSPDLDSLLPSNPDLNAQTPTEDWDPQVFRSGADDMIAFTMMESKIPTDYERSTGLQTLNDVACPRISEGRV